MGGVDSRRTVLERVLVVVALLASVRGYDLVLSGSRWWVLTVLVVVLVAVGTTAARLVAPRWATIIGLVLVVLVTSWLVVPSATWLGIPSPVGLVEELHHGWRVIRLEESPLEPPRSVIAILSGSFALLYVLLDRALETFARNGLTAAALTAAFTVPAMLAGQSPAPWIFVVTATVWLVLVWLRGAPAVSWPSVRPAAVMAVVAIVGALLFPRISPHVDASSIAWNRKQTASVFGTGVNPILALGENLRSSDDRVVLRAVQTSTTSPYLRMATLSTFTGRTWRPDSSWGSQQTGTDAEHAAEQQRQRITITAGALTTARIPVPYLTDRVGGTSRPVTLSRANRTARLTLGGSIARQTWTASYREQDYTREELIESSDNTADPVGEEFLTLPAKVPASIGAAARRHTAGLTSDYEKIEALQDWLRSDFTYSTTAPVAENYDGTGLDVIAKFLKVKKGYCVHFASTLAVMARILGIPSRIVVGYAPAQDTTLIDGKRVYLTRADELHAWTEVHLGSAGWVQFDATPGVGAATDVTAQQDESTAPTTAPQSEQVPTPEATSSAPAEQDPTTTSTETTDNDAVLRWFDRLAVVAVVAAVLALPLSVRRIRRRRRWRRGRRDIEPLWAEVLDTSADLFGTEVPRSATPAEAADRLSGSDRSPAMTALLDRVQASRYATTAVPPGADAVEEAERVVEELGRSAGRRRRLAALLWPRSLLRRR